jgi:hypothetical protein
MQPEPRLQPEHGVSAARRLLQKIHQALQAVELCLSLGLGRIREGLRVIHPSTSPWVVSAPAPLSASVYGNECPTTTASYQSLKGNIRSADA